MPPSRVSQNTNTNTKASLRVVVRKRPVQKGERDIIEVDPPGLSVAEDKVKVDLQKYVHQHQFSYDDTFGSAETTLTLFDRSVKDLVSNAFEGGTSTAFCFGQTNAGKTFTLFGEDGGLNFQELNGSEGDIEPSKGGLYLLAACDIFKYVEALREEEYKKLDSEDIMVKLSMYEIKGQKLHDLLNGKEDLKALEDENGVLQLVGLTQRECVDLEDFLAVSNVGRTARTTAATGANSTSSRSHCAMLIRVYKGDMLIGKLSLIDLAGSERGADNDNTDKLTRMEGRQINTSLLALKEVIRAMQNGGHAPFRQSRLTQVLEESLTGKQCKTVVIACVSPASINCQHTINTLRYGSELRTTKSSGNGIGSSLDNTKKRRGSVKAEQRGDATSSMRQRSQSSDSTTPNKRNIHVNNTKKVPNELGVISESPSSPSGINSGVGELSKRSLKPIYSASADDVLSRKQAYIRTRVSSKDSDSNFFLHDLKGGDASGHTSFDDLYDPNDLTTHDEVTNVNGVKEADDDDLFMINRTFSLSSSNDNEEKENSFASVVVARFGSSAQQLIRFLKYKGVSDENDLAKIDENEIAKLGKSEGLKTVQINKLKEWVRSLHPASLSSLSTSSKTNKKKKNITKNKTNGGSGSIDEGSFNDPLSQQNHSGEPAGDNTPTSKSSTNRRPSDVPKTSSSRKLVIAMNESMTQQESSIVDSNIGISSPSGLMNTGYHQNNSQLFPNLTNRTSLVEARFIAEAMGFGWDGVGFDLYWEMMERKGCFHSGDWPFTGNPLVTMLLLQRFLDKNDQFNKYLDALENSTSTKVELIIAQHKIELEEINKALPNPHVIALFEKKWSFPSFSRQHLHGNASSCMQLVDMLGMAARVYFELNRLKEAEEAALLGLGLDKNLYAENLSSSSSSSSSTSSKTDDKKKKKKDKPKQRKKDKNNTPNKTISTQDSSSTSSMIRIHCRRVLALLSIENHDMKMAEFHYLQAHEDAIKIEWSSMELLIAMDLKKKVYLPSNRETEANVLIDAACKKMQMPTSEVMSLFS